MYKNIQNREIRWGQNHAPVLVLNKVFPNFLFPMQQQTPNSSFLTFFPPFKTASPLQSKKYIYKCKRLHLFCPQLMITFFVKTKLWSIFQSLSKKHHLLFRKTGIVKIKRIVLVTWTLVESMNAWKVRLAVTSFSTNRSFWRQKNPFLQLILVLSWRWHLTKGTFKDI